MTRTPYPYRPNVRLTTKLDEFEQAMRDDPNYCQGKSQEKEPSDTLRIFLVATSAVALAVLLMWGLLYVVAVHPLSLPVTQGERP